MWVFPIVRILETPGAWVFSWRSKLNIRAQRPPIAKSRIVRYPLSIAWGWLISTWPMMAWHHEIRLVLSTSCGTVILLPHRPTQPRLFLVNFVIMGNILSRADENDASRSSPSAPKSSGSTSPAAAATLKQTIAQNMRLSKSKVTSLLKANHMNYSIVHRNHFYNSLPHVRILPRIASVFVGEALISSISEQRICLGLRLSGYLTFMTGNVKLLRDGRIRRMKSHE